ncbi:pro-sigmaK processing inhibitor BofA family protein [uncultured Oscillibacter sp.]|uniref:pro-sigmaK processing inhibitor BofA family protein n=1 Tax=uncultured Oscillibacter sp. TaxID=876091 RepID=UPI0025D749F7|nr:pro-sigmaK processing inhibitor BofA family protein [uncultured Oscillibacter sp.]
MDLNEKILAALLGGFFLIALIRVFRAPLRLAVRLLFNTALGFAALWGLRMTASVTGITLGLNPWNALVIGILGLPGLGLLLLAQWVL